MDAQTDPVSDFVAITGANEEAAIGALDAANWDLQEAVALYMAQASLAQMPCSCHLRLGSV